MTLEIANVAVDHADSTIARYVAALSLSTDRIPELRDGLLNVVFQSGADNVVVRPSDYARAATILGLHRVVVGMPDQENLTEAVSQLRMLWPVSSSEVVVKIGFAVHERDLPTLTRGFGQLLDVSGSNQFVVEPYFDDGVMLMDRHEWIATAGKCERVCALKLDIKNPRAAVEIYRKAAGSCPWYARSDGMTFREFQTGVDIVRHAGCAGVICGAAVWRSELVQLSTGDSDQALKNISQRLDTLRTAFSM